MFQATAPQTESKAPGALPSLLDEALREGARRMLQQAIEAEVATYIEAHTSSLDDRGHRLVVRNGHTPERVAGRGIRATCGSAKRSHLLGAVTSG